MSWIMFFNVFASLLLCSILLSSRQCCKYNYLLVPSCFEPSSSIPPFQSSEQSPQPTQCLCKNSEFLSFFVLYSRLLADFLSHLGKWVKLIKFEAENECFCTWKVEKPKCTTSTS